MDTIDTICAISTPPGMGGIAVARISGSDAIALTDRIWKGKRLTDALSHTAHLGTIIDPERPDEPLDQAVATVFHAPASFTGDNVVELSVHGSTYIQSELINLLVRQGCRLAEPGEFTRRAFASGKLDLAEAEAVADVIASTSRASHRVAMSQMRGQFSRELMSLRDSLMDLAALLELELDFSEEDVEFADRAHLRDIATSTLDTVERLADTFASGDAIRRGIPVAIVGRPNVGKSSILNLLVGDNRAIVSDIPGTTRDTIEDTATIHGHTYRFIDTAGLRHTTDTVENLGIDRAWEKIAQARIILWVITPEEATLQADNNDPYAIDNFHTKLAKTMHPEAHLIVIVNKTDLHAQKDIATLSEKMARLTGAPVLTLSTITGSSAPLRDAIHHVASPSLGTSDAIIVTNARHYQSLHNAIAPLRRVITALSPALPSPVQQPDPSSANQSPTHCCPHYPTPPDLIAQDVRETIHHLSTITGTITTPDILTTIFSRFCIGK